MSTPIRLVAGLGNPGRGYAATRHNAGFWFVDALAAKLGTGFGHEARFAADVAKAGDLRICKPMTFMNASGRSVAALARFFGIEPDAILVVHDELDLSPGDAKLKLGGGHAGHNGLRDIHAQLGTPEYWRLRLGIGHPRNTETPLRDVVDYVLKAPDAQDRDAIDASIDRVLGVWRDIAAGDMERAMMVVHTKVAT
ncbi:MAG TPA: aminoacyl-tRNA hydrolase [Casimicrobiaceae bacterium]|jgi:PTH1 family peptidyl-tRNA hydrolase|nr:aminoacyl-tRNA hydrolase [Casimicrobiaceae bacterium]